jgi:hypothetical protein
MWPGFDPETQRALQSLRRQVQLTHQTPTREWPLLYIAQQDLFFIVREWPDGTITAYTVGVPAPRSPPDIW